MNSYILDENKNPVLTNDIEEWTKFYNKKDRTVAKTEITPEIEVSTVFLGLEHGFSETGLPLLFETMIFIKGFGIEDDMKRYCTWDEATKGHEELVMKLLKKSEK